MIDDRDFLRLQRIVKVIDDVEDYIVRNGIDCQKILSDQDTQWMVSPVLEITEMVTQLSSETKALRPDASWRYMTGMRNRIAHNYEDISMVFSVNY